MQATMCELLPHVCSVHAVRSFLSKDALAGSADLESYQDKLETSAGKRAAVFSAQLSDLSAVQSGL